MKRSTILTRSEQKAMAFAPKGPALLSLIASMCVIVFFFRHPEKRAKMYHRLVFVMSLYGVLVSIMFLTGTSAFPSNTPSYGASGTVTSCTVQGMIAQLCIAVPLYYSSLSIYCYLAIKANFQEKKIVWIEKWIHSLIHVLILSSVIVIAVTENFNPSGPVCYIDTFPQVCGEDTNVPCQRGDAKQSARLAIIFSGLPVYGGLLVSIITMIVTYRMQIRKEDLNKVQRRKQVIFETARRKKSRIIAIQGSLYVMAFLITSICPIITRTAMMFGFPTTNYLRIIGACLLALQSFVFTIIYFGLQISGNREQQSQLQPSYCDELRKRLNESMTSQKSSKNVIKETVKEVDMSLLRRTMKRASYSIFDGSKISTSPWKMFLYDDDDDGDDEIIMANSVCLSRDDSAATEADLSLNPQVETFDSNDIDTDLEASRDSEVYVEDDKKRSTLSQTQEDTAGIEANIQMHQKKQEEIPESNDTDTDLEAVQEIELKVEP